MARVSDVVRAEVPESDDADAPLQVVVYRRGERTVGLVVNEILDIVEEEADVTSDISSEGVSSSLVISRRITELLDVRAAIEAADPAFFEGDDEEVGAA
jgi:two-component system chemotaxis sensor kinase CheA